jgi:hypothetical protein
MDPSENEDVRDDAVAIKAGSRALRAFVLEIGRTLSLAGTTASPDPVMPRIWSVMSSSSAKIQAERAGVAAHPFDDADRFRRWSFAAALWLEA